jgi:hypothetical protein
VPWLIVALLNGGGHGWWIAVLVAGGAVLVLHVRRQPMRASRASLWLVLTEAALLLGSLGAVIETVVTDSCGSSPAKDIVGGIGGGAIYLIGGAWALQRPRRGVWALPLAAIVAGGWIAAIAHLVPGGAGACFN